MKRRDVFKMLAGVGTTAFTAPIVEAKAVDPGITIVVRDGGESLASFEQRIMEVLARKSAGRVAMVTHRC